MYIKLTTNCIEYKVQIAKCCSKTHVQKITNIPGFFLRRLDIIFMRENYFEGFWHSFCLFPFQGPGPTPSQMALEMDLLPSKRMLLFFAFENLLYFTKGCSASFPHKLVSYWISRNFFAHIQEFSANWRRG